MFDNISAIKKSDLSSSMESFINPEGFKESLATHRLICKFTIAGDDSSVYKTITDLKPYSQHSIIMKKT